MISKPWRILLAWISGIYRDPYFSEYVKIVEEEVDADAWLAYAAPSQLATDFRDWVMLRRGL